MTNHSRADGTPEAPVNERPQDSLDAADGGKAHANAPTLPGPLRPFVHLVARIKASVHLKLLAGFLVGALLLLAMGVLSLYVINRMNQRVSELAEVEQRQDVSRQMIYLVTAQSHYRAMALLTKSQVWNDKIAVAKQTFAEDLDQLDRGGQPDEKALFDEMRASDQRFSASGERVLALYQSDDILGALNVHLVEEHEISHELESQLNRSLALSGERVAKASADFKADRRTLTTTVATFSGISLASALFLGLVLSWAFVWPVRRIDHALDRIARGDFTDRVDLSNRDEFGTLGENLNSMSGQLASLYSELEGFNATLQLKVDAQVQELERAMTLKRYLPPQIADSILAGDANVALASKRRNLTIFFCDVRGFTDLAERLEPEELIDMLNQYLTAMTAIVFKHGGTLDKYIGDAIMVFFGDPVPYEDHAPRAVRMALEMKARLAELQEQWSVEHEERLTIGMGITTGYVTVGNVGSAARAEYTVIGNHVNLASRLANRASAGQILVSEKTMVAVREIVEGSEVEQIKLKGVNRPIRIYAIAEPARPR